MGVLLEILIKLMSLTVIMIFLIGLLFIMLISVVYIAGYVYDSIFGNSFISLGLFISGKYLKIKNISIVEKLWRKIQPKELYLRYETPLFTYIITVLGFCFTITGMKVQELPLDFAIIENTYTSLMNYNDETNTLMLFLKLFVSGGLILILFYVISLPIQVISYFVISVINYFRKQKAGYIGLFKKFLGIVAYFLKNI